MEQSQQHAGHWECVLSSVTEDLLWGCRISARIFGDKRWLSPREQYALERLRAILARVDSVAPELGKREPIDGSVQDVELSVLTGAYPRP